MSRLKTSYEKSRVVGPLHTGGPVAISSDGLHIVTCVGEEAVLTRLSDGQELRRITADNETIHSFCLTPSSSHLLIFTASLSLHIYDDPVSPTTSHQSFRPTRTIARAHDAPAHVCVVDPTSTLLASGSADGVVKIWDIRRGYMTHVFKGHGGVVSALVFRYVRDISTAVNTEPTLHLVSGSVDTRLRVFDLSPSTSRSGSGKPTAVLEGHVSVPRGLDISPDGRWLISGGRDSVVLLWDFAKTNAQARATKGKGKEILLPILARTIPVLERVEATGWIGDDSESLRFFTAGEKGTVKVWDAQTGTLLFALNEEVEQNVEVQREITAACYVPNAGMILSVHADQNILLHSVVNKALTQQLIGFNDEIVGATFLSITGPDSHIAIAANSSLIRVYSVAGNDARLLSGHSGMILCLDHSADRRFFASGSKDKSARLWSHISPKSSWSCIAICEGHAESVGAVALSRKLYGQDLGVELPHFMFTGSQDRTIKMWDLSGLSAEPDADVPQRCRSLATHKAHDKDINSLDVSPNDRFLASGSQDRTAKVYEIIYSSGGSGGARGEIKLLGTCKGHKRGVWTVRFGKTERVLATGSGDKSIKLWSLDDFSCVKTLEGHTNSVLQIDFLNQDLQVASTASDGLLKLWNVRTEECIATMDNHEDKVWALALSTNESTIVTGAADSTVTFWGDCTKEKEHERQADREKTVLREQDYMNYISMKDYRNAISLALAMDQPGRLLSLFKTIISDPNVDAEDSGGASQPVIYAVLRRLSPVELATLLRHTRDWNANARTSTVAQTLLNVLFKLRTVEDIADAFEANEAFLPIKNSTAALGGQLSLNELVQTLIPYTERHLARLDRLVQDSYILDYVLGEMDGGLIADDDGMEVDL
ncbi:WD40 repeat-like protein [Phellopilus nigrolimitatus]|nr:WD40 repeat-like protein [Phellopilus nigrolimitatus]